MKAASRARKTSHRPKKGKESQYPELRKALGACWGELSTAAVMSFFMNILMLTPSLYMLQIFRRVIQSHSIETLVVVSLMAFAAVAVWGILSWLRGSILTRMSAKIDLLLGERIHAALVANALNSNEGRGIQALRDLSQLRNALAGSVIQYMFDAPWTPIFLAVIYLLHPVLGMIGIGGALIMLILAWVNDIATRPLISDANRSAQVAYTDASNNVRNAEVVEGMGMMRNVMRRWLSHNVNVLRSQGAATERSDLLQAISGTLQLVLQMSIYGAGAFLVIEREMDVAPMMAAVFLFSRALAPLRGAIRVWRELINMKDSCRRIEQLLSTAPRLTRSDMQLPKPKGRIEVENVTFVPPNGEKPTLKDISFALEAGESLGIIGPSASGKSTLAKILVGVWRPARGLVRLDGADVASWNPDDLGQYVGFLPQDVELFGGTVKDNICRMGDAPAQAIISAARLSGTHQMILRLPKGYETEIGEGGSVLSGGQKQRIGLARAVFGNPRLLVLDEPNANLDSAGEEALRTTIKRLKANGTTVIIVAHRPSILGGVDKLLMLNDGAVETFGPRTEVLEHIKRQTRDSRVVELRGQSDRTSNVTDTAGTGK